ncbi:uncharacterized protein UBRO_20192 [Ustilago bromivora]|uniref:Uncharacterized protein n=1 Tax=Ustilago bromivora TaxID=307758 RepID=A0A1K0HA51_9BASI|nr:uncharacterized protein UBRO_20192 [Ustilago bromivora]
MPPVCSNISHHHASSTGPALVPATGQTHVSDKSTTLTTRHFQDNDSSVDLTSDQDSTDNPAIASSTSQHKDGSDETMEDSLLAEPDQRAFQPIFTGRLIWSATRSDKPIAPFEELPIPKSDHARVPPCTVCWQFTHNFNLNWEEDITQGSLRLQARQQLQAKGFPSPACVVNFPRGTGCNHFVEIMVPSDQLAALSDISLVFNKTSLQRVLVGSALPRNYLALEILDIPQTNAPTATTCYMAHSLKTYAQVHDVWVCQVSYPNDPRPPADTNIFIALISTPAGDEGGLDLVRLHAIPGYVQILTNEFAAAQQADETERGANNLDYGA